MEKVWILKKGNGESDKEATLKILKQFDATRLLNGSEKILIKPNWVHNEHYCEGNCTSTQTLAGIVQYLIQDCNITPSNIYVGDSAFSDTAGCIITNNVKVLNEEFAVNILNLDAEAHINKKVQNPLSLKQCKIASITEVVDVIISVPSLKTHIWAVTTLSMKNLMGVMDEKYIMHSDLHRKIADLTSIFLGKMRFSIIDGFIGSDYSETGGNPVVMDLIMIAEDPVALDTVGSKVIGYDIDDCQYLRFANEKGLGNCDVDGIEIIGPPIDNISKKFKR